MRSRSWWIVCQDDRESTGKKSADQLNLCDVVKCVMLLNIYRWIGFDGTWKLEGKQEVVEQIVKRM